MGSATFSVATFAADHPEFKDLYMTHGKSAYQAAVEQGYEGTEEEWVAALTELRFGTYETFTDKEERLIYIDLERGSIFRYDITKDDYIPIGGVLGETEDTAYRGDRGKIAYDHAMSPHAPSDAQKNSDITKGEIEEKLTGEIETHRHNAVNIIEDPKRRFITDEERALWNGKADADKVNEANLQWGGRDLANELSPIDAAMVPELSANRLAYMTAKDITVEYSRDDGETWTDYCTDVNNGNKTYLTTLNNGKGDHHIGKWESGETADSTWKLRVTLIGSVIHCHAKKIALIISTNGSTNCKCLLERSYNSSKTTFEEEKEVDLDGYPGWNIIQVDERFGGSLDTSVYAYRMTFSADFVGDSGTEPMMLSGIRLFAPNCWNTYSNFGQYGTLYTIDAFGNAYFTNSVSSIYGYFKGKFLGNASTASKFETARMLTIGNTAKSFDGSEDVSWSLAEMGAVNRAGDSISGTLKTRDLLPIANLEAKIGSTNLVYSSIISKTHAMWNNDFCYGSISIKTDGTSNTIGLSMLELGNAIESGKVGNSKGIMYLYGENDGYTEIIPGNNTSNNITLTFPKSNGTLALTTDLECYPDPMEKVLLFYGNPVSVSSDRTVDGAYEICKNYDIIIWGDGYNETDHGDYANTLALATMIKTKSPDIRIVGYIPIGMDNSEGSNLDITEISRRITLWQDLKVDGIFLDEFGYDYKVTRERQNEIVELCHSANLFVIANSWSLDYVFSSDPITISWLDNFEPNPDGLDPLINGKDYYLFENLFFSVDDETGAYKSSNPWRFDNIINYRKLAVKDGKSYYDIYKTKIISLDSLPSTFTDNQFEEIISYSIIAAKIFNMDAIAFGDEHWGSGGYYHDWDFPNVYLKEYEYHPITAYTKISESGSTFPYKWTAEINSNKFTYVCDVTDSEDRIYDSDTRYVKMNSYRVKNLWTTVHELVEKLKETNETINVVHQDTMYKEVEW